VDDQPVKRGRGRPKTGMTQKGADRQAAYERRKKDRAMTMAAMLHLLSRNARQPDPDRQFQEGRGNLDCVTDGKSAIAAIG
jgi:hypothetical protein